MMQNDTIAAISTALGIGGIGIVRLSGPEALQIADGLFRGKRKPSEVRDRALLYGWVVEDGEEIDEVLVSVMRGPRSYTTEDVVEFNCHGGGLVVRRVLEAVCRKGARLAERGEFTKRAFLGGRIDLAQAEAVLDVVQARGERGLRSAYFQMRGGLSRRIEAIRERLRGVLAWLEASLDFPEEEFGISAGEVLEEIEGVMRELRGMRDSFDRGRVEREGATVVVVGRPNVGKSSVMNALLGEDRAIVADVPGTTRDVVEGWVELGGVGVRLLDTAGIRRTGDVVELEGRRRAVMHAAEADVVLMVVDGSTDLTGEDEEVAGVVEEVRKIVVVNKIDLERVVGRGRVTQVFGDARMVEISAKEGWGVDELAEAIVEEVLGSGVEGRDGPMIMRLRHRECVERALNALECAWKGLEAGVGYELVALDVRDSMGVLGEIMGEMTPEDILDRIFEEFCVGK